MKHGLVGNGTGPRTSQENAGQRSATLIDKAGSGAWVPREREATQDDWVEVEQSEEVRDDDDNDNDSENSDNNLLINASPLDKNIQRHDFVLTNARLLAPKITSMTDMIH